MELTDALREYVEQKIRPLEKLTTVASESLHAAVEIGKTTHHHKQGNVFRAEVNLHIAHDLIRAVAVQEDLYAAIDEMKQELAVDLAKHKGKKKTLFKRGAQAVKAMLRGAENFIRRRRSDN